MSCSKELVISHYFVPDEPNSQTHPFYFYFPLYGLVFQVFLSLQMCRLIFCTHFSYLYDYLSPWSIILLFEKLIVIKVIEKLSVLLTIILVYLYLNYNHFRTSVITQSYCIHQYPKRQYKQEKKYMLKSQAEAEGIFSSEE